MRIFNTDQIEKFLDLPTKESIYFPGWCREVLKGERTDPKYDRVSRDKDYQCQS